MKSINQEIVPSNEARLKLGERNLNNCTMITQFNHAIILGNSLDQASLSHFNSTAYSLIR